MSGCGHADRAQPKLRVDLGPARHFRGFTLFYAGKAFGKFPLTLDGRFDIPPKDKGNRVNLGYGDCTPAPNSEDRCGPPVVVTNSRICTELPSKYTHQSLRRIELRGVPAIIFLGEKPRFSKLELYTRYTTVEIEGLDYRRSLELARRLMPLNHRPFGRNLPAPAPKCARRELLSPP
jgi:hypothetical protein